MVGDAAPNAACNAACNILLILGPASSIDERAEENE